MKIKSVHHIAIICSDYKKSKDFYVNKLGFKILAENYRKEKESYKLDLCIEDKRQIELFSFPNSPERASKPESCGLRHLAFEVEKIEEVINELKKEDILCEDIRIDEFTGKKFTFFQDPDGLPLELYEN
jgi:glyoxylase I family protein